MHWDTEGSGETESFSSKEGHMRSIRCCVTPVAVAVVLFGAQWVAAGGAHCARCGCSEPCQKVCRLVVEEKKVDVTCWGGKCEPFCVPGPSQPGCENCESVCGSSDGSVHAACKKFVWTEWTAGRAQVYTKKKLMKKTVTQ